MAAALERLGHRVRVFAQTTIGRVGKTSKPAALAEFTSRAPNDLAIYHFSIGWPPALPLLRSLTCRRVVRYHNITPAHFFEGYSPEYVGACASGRAEIAPLAELDCELYLGDSPFNVEDFLAAGVAAERTAVLPPFNRIGRLLHAHADLAMLDRYKSHDITWLSVGRLSPNKNHLDLVVAFAAYPARPCDDAVARLLGRRARRSAPGELHARARCASASMSLDIGLGDACISSAISAMAN